MGIVYLMTRTSALDGANRLSSMISVNMPTTGIVTTMTCEVAFHGNSLNLKKISQTIRA